MLYKWLLYIFKINIWVYQNIDYVNFVIYYLLKIIIKKIKITYIKK
jgi:hypothetical protein